MKDKYTPGQDCGCYAYSESECGCGADWTPSEVHELRGKLERERALADRLAKALLSFCSSGMVWPNTDTPEKAIAAWKEARSE